MRIADSPFLADWFAVLLRWIALFGLATSLALASQLNSPIGALVVFGVLWNVVVSLLAITNSRLPQHRVLNVVIDVLIAGAIFWMSGGFNGPVAWVGLLAVSSGAIYYELLGGLVTAGIFAVLQAIQAFILLDPAEALLPFGLAAVFYVVAGVVLGLVSKLLIKRIRRKYQKLVADRMERIEQARQQEHDRMTAFYDLTATLSTTLSYQTVLDSTLDLGARVMEDQGEPSKMTSAFLVFAGKHLAVGAARRLGQADLRVELPAEQGALAAALARSDPQVLANPSSDAELCHLTALASCRSAVVYALRSRLEIYGLLLYAHPDADFFDDSRLEVIEAIARQATLAIQNALLYQGIEQEKQRLIETQEEARKKLARDLHDGPTQTVSSIAMQTEITRRMLLADPEKGMAELLRIEELARRATRELRHMLFTLRPLALENQGLLPALEAMAQKMAETYNQNVLLEIDAAVAGSLDTSKQSVAFYLVEEAVNNARKHARAAHIWVRLESLSKMTEMALLSIKDDGEGFDVKSVESSYDTRGSLGLVNLRERAELVGGVLKIDSAPGQGTCVQVFIPLTEAAAERMRNPG